MTSSPSLTHSLINIEEAKTNLTTLISQVEKGEEIIITQEGIPVAKIVPYKESKEPRPLGIDRGKFTIESEAATQEIREIPGIMELLEVTEAQAKAGHLIDWEDTEDDL